MTATPRLQDADTHPRSRPGERRVANFVVSTGLTGLAFLGLTVSDWINLALSVLMFAGGYIL